MASTSNIGNTTPESLAQAQPSKPVLRLGCEGEAVEELQRLLAQQDIYDGDIDGIFEKVTQESVKEYQCRVFLLEDGIVGEKTWQALYAGVPANMPELKKGSRGELVKRLQRFLKSTQDYVGYVDGNFGSITQAAVQTWQMGHNLPDTGIVDEKTWDTLCKYRH